MFGKHRHTNVRGKLSDFYESVRLADFFVLLPSPFHVLFLVLTNDFRPRADDHAQSRMEIHVLEPVGLHLSFVQQRGWNVPAAIERWCHDRVVADCGGILVNGILLLESRVALLHLHREIQELSQAIHPGRVFRWRWRGKFRLGWTVRQAKNGSQDHGRGWVAMLDAPAGRANVHREWFSHSCREQLALGYRLDLSGQISEITARHGRKRPLVID